MSDHCLPSDDELELQEYLESARELEAARVLEEAEFIRDQDSAEQELEETSGELQDAPVGIIEDAGARRSYWQAQGLEELEQAAFAAALEQDDAGHQRSAYYRLAVYHGRTIYILRSALNAVKEALAQAAMRNLATLHRALMQMHRQAPHNVPVALVLDRQGRDVLARDLVMRALQESAEPQELDAIVQRVNDLDVMGVARGTVQRHLKDLVASGHVDLDERLLALLAEVAPVELQARVQAQGLSSLTDEERTGIAIALMRHYNKVTHIFELVKAYGSTTQVAYDRTERVWQRRENIAAKHAHEIAVNPFNGQKLTGDGHAPLVYAQDPRVDLPAELQQRLVDAIDGSDGRIVSGWLQYGLARQDGAL